MARPGNRYAGGSDVWWGRLIAGILFSPILFGVLISFVVLYIVKLPSFCCEHRRSVQYLPYAGLAYYGLAIPLLLVVFGLTWWGVLLVAVWLALGGDWLLPDPFTYVFSPRKRRAVKAAIAFVEAEGGTRPNYGKVRVIGSEPDRTVVGVAINSHTKPPAWRFLVVGDDTTSIEETDFEYVSTKHGVRHALR